MDAKIKLGRYKVNVHEWDDPKWQFEGVDLSNANGYYNARIYAEPFGFGATTWYGTVKFGE